MDLHSETQPVLLSEGAKFFFFVPSLGGKYRSPQVTGTGHNIEKYAMHVAPKNAPPGPQTQGQKAAKKKFSMMFRLCVWGAGEKNASYVKSRKLFYIMPSAGHIF